MKAGFIFVKIVLYCTLFFGVITTGYSHNYTSSNATAYAGAGGWIGSGERQAPGPFNGDASFGGISLLLGLILLYGVKKLADAHFTHSE